MCPLSSAERRRLRARAHRLHPVVSISRNGLSASVLKEIDCSLTSHELIKVRVFDDDRQSREQVLDTLCIRLDAAPVQHIGKLLVIWRPRPSDQRPVDVQRPASNVSRPLPRVGKVSVKPRVARS